MMKKMKMKTMKVHAPVEIWSCDPKDITKWTEADEIRLNTALGSVYGWGLEVIADANRKVSERHAAK